MLQSRDCGPERRRYRAPGRVNLIGEHTDYNDGFVLPAAIEYYTRVTATRRRDRRVGIVSAGFADTVEFDLGRLASGVRHAWHDHLRGLLIELQRDGAALGGADLAIETDLPIGAGLSSSASVCIAVGFAMLDLAGVPIDPLRLALAAQRAENAHAGAHTGIMDQFACAGARSGTALLLDTRTLAASYVPLPREADVVICKSATAHEHATGGYNRRRAECREGVRALQTRYPEISALRDVTLAALEAASTTMPETIFRRCRHVVTENERTQRAAQALRDDDLAGFGAAMNASHASMRDDYEISVPAIDTLVDLAQRFGDSVYGARMTGGGFGGCTVNLVASASSAAFIAYIKSAYREATGFEPPVYRGAGAHGAERIA